MAVPKKKTSVSRKGLRRAGQHHKLYRKHPMKQIKEYSGISSTLLKIGYSVTYVTIY